MLLPLSPLDAYSALLQTSPLATKAATQSLIWGVGDVRSREWYEEYSGVRFEAKQVSAQAERGGMPTDACFWNQFACLDAWLQAREAPHPEE